MSSWLCASAVLYLMPSLVFTCLPRFVSWAGCGIISLSITLSYTLNNIVAREYLLQNLIEQRDPKRSRGNYSLSFCLRATERESITDLCIKSQRQILSPTTLLTRFALNVQIWRETRVFEQLIIL